MIPIVEPDAFVFIGIAALSYFLGRRIKAAVPLLQKLSIPVPFLGGLPVAVLILFLKLSGYADIRFDTALNVLVLKFFLTLIALFGTWRLICRGAGISVLFWVSALVLGILQAAVGIGSAEILGFHRHMGILLGSLSMIGGYDSVSNFAAAVEYLDGIQNASEIALGVVTIGMIVSLMIGAPLGEYLISRYNLRNNSRNEFDNQRLSRSILRSERPFYQTFTVECMKVLAIAFVCIALGDWVNRYLLHNVLIPDYVSCMIFAMIVRNFSDKSKLFSVDGLALRSLTKVSLTLFIALSTCSLKLESIAAVTPSVLLILAAELVLTLVYARYVYFSLLGRNFPGMLLTVGGFSFSMGVCGNGLSNMQSLCEKYGPSTDGFLVLSIVGLIMLNISNVFFINTLLRIF